MSKAQGDTVIPGRRRTDEWPAGVLEIDLTEMEAVVPSNWLIRPRKIAD